LLILELKFQEFSDFSIPPPVVKKGKGKKKGKVEGEEVEESEPEWRYFATMKEALDAGWMPGQSFSFRASDVKGQKLVDKDVSGAKPVSSLPY